MNKKAKLIAFYLPQFYPTPENDEWWQPGFTEWTNVAKAKPLFKGHYQPKIPRDLGFYDLRVSETREKQAALAQQYGIGGFCYWHYWFAGRQLLDIPFNEVVASGKPDFPFCLCWANHSWYKKMWNPDSKGKDILLIKQTYPGKDDYVNHFNALLTAFKDKRYIRDDNGKLLFLVYSPLTIPDVSLFFETWNRLAFENGLNGFRFIGYAIRPEDAEPIREQGFDDAVVDYFQTGRTSGRLYFFKSKIQTKIFQKADLFDYDRYIKSFDEGFVSNSHNMPCVLPNFDHSPRSRLNGVIYANSSPEKWEELLTIALKKTREKANDNFIFIKAWNEWGEGNYLEPDLKYGHGFLQAVLNALDKAE